MQDIDNEDTRKEDDYWADEENSDEEDEEEWKLSYYDFLESVEFKGNSLFYTLYKPFEMLSLTLFFFLLFLFILSPIKLISRIVGGKDD